MKFEIIESDFWGYFPIRSSYELRDDVLREMKDIVYDAVFVHGASAYLQRRKVSSVEVAYCVEMNEHWHTVQYRFRTKTRQNGNTGQFTAYCMAAVLEQYGMKSTCTVDEIDGIVEVVVALPRLAADMVIQHVCASNGRTFQVSKVSTVVDTLGM